MKRRIGPLWGLAAVLLIAAGLLAASHLLPETNWASPALSRSGTAVPLPILMYHSVLRDPSRSGDYVVTPDLLEQDLAFLASHGYTTLFPSELAQAVLHGEALPEKPVILSFDDGYQNTLTYVLPLLERYDMKAVASVVGSYSEQYSLSPDPNPSYAYLSWEGICALADSGRFEIANHSYDMHRQFPRRGAMRIPGEDPVAYCAALRKDAAATQSLLTRHCGILPTTYAYPYGHISPESVPVLRELGFTVLLTCESRINQIDGSPESLLSLGRFNRPAGVATDEMMARIGIG